MYALKEQGPAGLFCIILPLTLSLHHFSRHTATRANNDDDVDNSDCKVVAFLENFSRVNLKPLPISDDETSHGII